MKRNKRWRMLNIINFNRVIVSCVIRIDFTLKCVCLQTQLFHWPRFLKAKVRIELCRSFTTRSNHQYKIQTKLAKLNCYKYSFLVKVIKFWNDLPSNVIKCHDSPNVNKLKLRLKNHMNIY